MSDLHEFALDQEKRLISVEECAIGKRKLLVTSFDGIEELSRLSRFTLEIASMGRALHPGEMLGQKMAVALRIRGKVRKINGIVSRFAVMQTAIRQHFLHQIEIVPPSWVLTLNQHCRIFHDKKVSDIVGNILHEAGLSSRLKASGSVRDYTVAYCESDFQFISRLLEDEGAFYRFAHEERDCGLVTGDCPGDYMLMNPATLEFHVDIQKWQPRYAIGAATFKHADWDFKAADVIEGSANTLPKTQPAGMQGREVFAYPGKFSTADEGRKMARVRIEERESEVVLIDGASTSAMVQAGAKFKVKDLTVDLPGENEASDTYVAIQVRHRLRDAEGTPFEGDSDYMNEFLCMPADLAFRPSRMTPKPRLVGPQTARVTDGPDDFGRAKVKFPWLPAERSCWVRVAQSLAFNKMGTQYLPRIDSEVVVEFLDGDPDRPLIVGMVYNGKNKLPFTVPDHKTQSGMRGANWGDAGVPDTSNELRFEDLSGAEEIYLHAQKDFRRVVVNDDTLIVEQGDRRVDVKQGDVSETLSMGNYAAKLSQGNHSTELSLGNHSVKASTGSSTIEALQSITLKVGDNSLTIDATGVTIKGMMVSVEGQLQLDLKGLMTSVNGDGMLTLKGSITMVN